MSSNIPNNGKNNIKSFIEKVSKTKTWFVCKTLLWIFLCTSFICLLAFLGYMYSLDATIDIEIEAMKLNYSSIVYYQDENGVEHEYERLFDSQNRTWVNLEDMPEHLKNAAIAIEDHRFLKHNGVDWKRTLSASVNMFFKMKSDFGASTITQQLVKNLTGDNQDSVKRKLQEIRRALYLENHYDKDTIIEMYLNTIYLGEGCYGVGTAAETYYGKKVSDLTIAESAALIGITNLPTYYNPYLHPENNRTRCVDILNRMHELKMISEEEHTSSIAEEIVFNQESQKEDSSTVQSYFVDQIIEDVINDLMSEYGYSENIAEKMIYSGGLKIYATVKPEIQSIVDNVFESSKTFPKYAGSVQPECAMIILDPTNGDVLAMRGGRGEKKAARLLNRATQTKRPPGSTIKPISVYAPAIEYGLITPYSVEDDAPLKVLNGSAYPKNETRTYSGRTTINEAVKQSLNTVSMRTLDKLTIERSYNFLSANLGVTSLSKKGDKNLAPLALGQLTNGITVLEMAAAYAPFSNGGIYNTPRTYTKVIDSNNNVILSNDLSPIQAMSPKTATYVNHMLQNVIASGTGTYAKLNKGMPAGAKTGTSNNDEDRWFVGYTPYYVGAVWFGYDQPKYISKSLSPALTVWKTVMNSIHKNLPNKNFEVSEDFQYVNVCSCSGLLPTDACRIDPRGSRIVAAYLHKNDIPKKKCNVHVSVTIDSSTNKLATQFCPSGNKKTVGLMNLNRTFPISGVVLTDEQYVIHSNIPTSGSYFSSGVANPINTYCTVHTKAPEPEIPIAPPPETQESTASPESPTIPPTNNTTQIPPADVVIPDNNATPVPDITQSTVTPNEPTIEPSSEQSIPQSKEPITTPSSDSQNATSTESSDSAIDISTDSQSADTTTSQSSAPEQQAELDIPPLPPTLDTNVTEELPPAQISN